MKFDRNTVIGFAVLAVLFIGFFYYSNQAQLAASKNRAKEQAVRDSTILANAPKRDSVALQQAAAKRDTVVSRNIAGQFPSAANAPEQLVYTENEVFKIAFTTKGGQPKMVELKKFKNQDSGYVKLAATKFD